MTKAITLSLLGLDPTMPSHLGAFVSQQCSSSSSSAKKMLLDAGLIHHLERLLDSETMVAAGASALAISTIISGTFVKEGNSSILPTLIQMIESGETDICPQAIQAVQSIACIGEDARLAAIDAGVVPAAVKAIQLASRSMVRAAADALSSLADISCAVRRERLLEPSCIQAVLRVIESWKGSTQQSAVRSLLSIARLNYKKGHSDYVDNLRFDSAVKPLENIVAEATRGNSACTDAAKALTQVQSCGRYMQQSAIYSSDVMAGLLYMLRSGSSEMQKAAAQYMSHMSKQFSHPATKPLFQSGALSVLISIFKR